MFIKKVVLLALPLTLSLSVIALISTPVCAVEEVADGKLAEVSGGAKMVAKCLDPVELGPTNPDGTFRCAIKPDCTDLTPQGGVTLYYKEHENRVAKYCHPMPKEVCYSNSVMLPCKYRSWYGDDQCKQREPKANTNIVTISCT